MHKQPTSLAIASMITALLGASIAAESVSAADWPGWRGPEHNGVSRESGLNWAWPSEGPKVVWQTSVGKGFASFAVAGNRAVTLGNEADVDTIHCVDAATGKAIWKHSYPCPSDPLAHEGGPSATPVIDGACVYTLSKAGHYFCLDLESGRVIWSGKFDPPPTTKEDYKVWWGFAGSPLVSGGVVIFSFGSAGVALDKKTGAVLWTNGPGRPGYSSPVPFQNGATEAFAFLGGHELVGAEIASGRVLWRIPWKTTWDQNAPDVIISDKKLFASSGHGVGCALFDLESGSPKQVWRNKNMRSQLSSSVLWNGNLYGYDENRLTCLDWKTGDVKWGFEDSRQGSVMIADEKLVALEENGMLRVVEASNKAYKPVATAQILSGRCWTVPVIADGRLFARSAAGKVVCVDLRK